MLTYISHWKMQRKSVFGRSATVAIRPVAVVRDFPAGACFAAIAAAHLRKSKYRFPPDSSHP